MAPIRVFPSCGAKFRAAKCYPAPRYPVVIEPFAGGAGYSCKGGVEVAHLYDMGGYVYGARFDEWRDLERSDFGDT